MIPVFIRTSSVHSFVPSSVLYPSVLLYSFHYIGQLIILWLLLHSKGLLYLYFLIQILFLRFRTKIYQFALPENFFFNQTPACDSCEHCFGDGCGRVGPEIMICIIKYPGYGYSRKSRFLHPSQKACLGAATGWKNFHVRAQFKSGLQISCLGFYHKCK